MERIDESDPLGLSMARSVVAHVRSLGPLPADGVSAGSCRRLFAADIFRTIVPGDACQAHSSCERDEAERHD